MAKKDRATTKAGREKVMPTDRGGQGEVAPQEDGVPQDDAVEAGEEVVDEAAPAEAQVTEEEAPGPQKRKFVLSRASGQRIDVYLHNRLKGISRSKVQELIKMGGVTVNEKTPKASTPLRQGDVIEVILPPPAVRHIIAEPIPLDVLYEDEAFIVVNKQADLIVHPARGKNTGTLLNGLAWRFKQRVESAGGQWQGHQTRGFASRRERKLGVYQSRTDPVVPGLSTVGAADFRPGIVHRLDKNTTGVMVVAKHDAAHWKIARQFEDRSTLKAYLALVHGNFPEAAGVIDEPLGKHPTLREAYAVRRDAQGKRAVTIFRVREQYRGYALVELELKTGRTHQIRIHLQYLGHPIVGDVMYGGEPVGQEELDEPPVPAGGRRRFFPFARGRDEGLAIEQKARGRADLIMTTPALHATFLRFVHPVTEEAMTFTAPVHEPMRGLVMELRKRPGTGPVAQQGTWVDLKMAMRE